MTIIFLVAFMAVSVVIIYFALREMVIHYKNPEPLFCNGDKRFREILEDKSLNYKTRSLLKDIKYDKK